MKKVTVKKIEFRSQKEACEYFKISEQTVNDRLKRKWSIDDAYTIRPKNSPKETTIDGTTYHSVRTACKHTGKSKGTVDWRMNHGLNAQEAFNAERYERIKADKENVFGVWYPTKRSACEYHKVNYNTVTSHMRRKKMSLEEAISYCLERKKHSGE